MSTSKWVMISIANGPYVKYLVAMLESLRKTGTEIDVVVTLVGTDGEELEPLCDEIIRLPGKENESMFCVHHKPMAIKRAMDKYEHVLFLDADSIVWGNLDVTLKTMQEYEFCCKQKHSVRLLTPMMAMKSSDKMRGFCDYHAEATRVRAARSPKPWGAGQRSMKEVWEHYCDSVSLWRIPGNVLDTKWRPESLIWTAIGPDGGKSHDTLLRHWRERENLPNH